MRCEALPSTWTRDLGAGLDCACLMHRMLRWAPMGMGVESGASAAEGPAPSFTDGTRQDLSAFVFARDDNTRDLFETAGRGQAIVVRGGTVIPMVGPTSLPAHDIIAIDGVIKAVQASGSALPDGALIVDATGCYVVPGLSEMHTHPTTNNTAAIWTTVMGPGVSADALTLPYDLLMFLYLAAGITRIQVMAGTPEHLALRDAVRAGRIRGPVMRVASPVIDGYPPIWAPDISWLIGDEEGARHAARQIAARGYDFAKPYTKLSARAYGAFAAECRALGIEMTGHIPKAVRTEEAFALGQSGVAHTFEFFANADDPERFTPETFERRARMAANLGVVTQSTLMVAYAFEYDVGLRPDGCDSEAFLDPVMRYLMNEKSFFIQSWRSDPAMVLQGQDNVKNSVAMAQALVAEGARIVTGTDIPNPNGVGRQSLHEEFTFLHRDVGMAPIDVLRAATVHAAEHMGEGAIAGAVAPGQRADLVVLGDDPVLRIDATTRIEAVVHGDAVLRKSAIETGMARAVAFYAAMPVAAHPV